MTNREKYKDEILELAVTHNTAGFSFLENKIIPCRHDSCNCCKFSSRMNSDLSSCSKRFITWLNEEYVEPPVDWTKIQVDTKILVRDSENEEWCKRHFAKYENGGIYAFCVGRSSWTDEGDDDVVGWKYAKLWKEE